MEHETVDLWSPSPPTTKASRACKQRITMKRQKITRTMEEREGRASIRELRGATPKTNCLYEHKMTLKRPINARTKEVTKGTHLHLGTARVLSRDIYEGQNFRPCCSSSSPCVFFLCLCTFLLKVTHKRAQITTFQWNDSFVKNNEREPGSNIFIS